MKVIILAGGKGTRIHEESNNKPKPMINICGKPIIIHIMNHFIKYGFNEFIVAGGYKYKLLKNFFYKSKYNVRVINTGMQTMTAGRILKLKKILMKEEDFFLTYGDGISNIDIKKLLKHHIKSKITCTITAIKPKFRLGVLKIRKNGKISVFTEKPNDAYCNGGYMVMNKKIFKKIKDHQSILEVNVLPKLANKGELTAYKHHGFWKCIDNMKDNIEVEKILKNKKSWQKKN